MQHPSPSEASAKEGGPWFESTCDHTQRSSDLARLPLRAERYARSREARRILGSWLDLTRTGEDHGYDQVLRFKGLTSRIEEAIHAELRSDDPEVAQLAEELRLAEANLAAVAYGTRPHDPQVARRVSALNDQIAAPNPTRHKAIQAVSTSKWPSIQRRLRGVEALVDFFRCRDRYEAWVLMKEGKPVRIDLGPAQIIDSVVERFVNGVSTGAVSRSVGRGLVVISDADHDIPIGVQLRALVWEPIEAVLGEGISTIYLSPDGALATIPFGALPGRKINTILWEDYVLSWLVSAHDLSRELSVSTAHGALLVGVNEGDDHDDLPFTKNEVLAVRDVLGEDAEVYTDDQATESKIRSRVSGRRILHFASHGWGDREVAKSWVDWRSAALPESDVSPGNDRARENETTVNIRELVVESPADDEVEDYIVSLDPTLRSGLKLRGSDEDERSGLSDGYLTALEISSLDLEGVDLVVLSGCDTAGRPRGGDGVVGLVRAFREAGAHSVVASLFLVLDTPATVEMIRRFHEYARNSRSDYPLALRRAALELKAQGQDASIWAPFVAYGAVR
jgi:hypothetical protein